MKYAFWGVVGIALMVLAASLWQMSRRVELPAENQKKSMQERSSSEIPTRRMEQKRKDPESSVGKVACASAQHREQQPENSPSEPETGGDREPDGMDAAEVAAEKAVKAFEDLTDALREPIRGDIALKRVDDFVRKFKVLPKERQDEELHHALNLIPDDNSLFLLGVLMDAEVDKELKELVFNDFLNRGDEVKQPMLKAVFKQKSHPCWADAAWILDVTGALPAQKAQ